MLNRHQRHYMTRGLSRFKARGNQRKRSASTLCLRTSPSKLPRRKPKGWRPQRRCSWRRGRLCTCADEKKSVSLTYVVAFGRPCRQASTITARSVASIGDENASCAPALLKQGSSAMLRRRSFKRSISFQDKLEAWTKVVRDQAEALPPGPEREALLKKASQAETASHLDEWINSPGLQTPK